MLIKILEGDARGEMTSQKGTELLRQRVWFEGLGDYPMAVPVEMMLMAEGGPIPAGEYEVPVEELLELREGRLQVNGFALRELCAKHRKPGK